MTWEPSVCGVINCDKIAIWGDTCIYCKDDVCRDHFNKLNLCPICYERLKDETLEKILWRIENDDC